MDKSLDDIEFTIFDTETTGLEPQAGDRIVEIAGIRFRGRQRLAVFSSLVNPKRPISEAAYQVNRITQEMLKDAPLAEEVMPGFLNFIKDSYLCSYNAAFDLGFLNNELKLIGRQSLNNIAVADILKMARRLLPGLERYSLCFVAERLGIKITQEHRALSDVELTLQTFFKLQEALKSKGISDLANFSGLFGVNPGLLADVNNQKAAEIQEAIDLQVKLRIKYLSSSTAQVSEREVIPKQIQKKNGKDYLVAHCCLKNEERTFRIDGILHFEII